MRKIKSLDNLASTVPLWAAQLRSLKRALLLSSMDDDPLPTELIAFFAAERTLLAAYGERTAYDPMLNSLTRQSAQDEES